MSHAGTEHKGVQETEKKYITLPAPCIRTLIRATELELQRLDAADPLNDHQVAQNTLESARKVVEGKDGEFAALPRETAAQLDDYAAVIHTNEVKHQFLQKQVFVQNSTEEDSLSSLQQLCEKYLLFN